MGVPSESKLNKEKKSKGRVHSIKIMGGGGHYMEMRNRVSL